MTINDQIRDEKVKEKFWCSEKFLTLLKAKYV